MDPINPYAATSEVGDIVREPNSALATRSQRFAGAFLDGIIQLIIVFPLGFLLGMFIAMQAGQGAATQVAANLAGGLLGIVVFIALNGYFLATQGKTIGKLAVGTRIVDRDTGQLVPLWPLIGKRYLWLWVVTMIPIVNIFVPMINALMIFRESRACLHDDFANTKVIVDEAF